MFRPPRKKPSPAGCYDLPQYWDLAFRSETRREVDFFEQAFRKYGVAPARRLLEPGCGGGRLVVELARRGHQVTAFDLNEHAVDYLRSRLHRRQLAAHVAVGDMATFRFPGRFDAAYCTFNTFRHLLTERAALSHLRLVAEHLRPGGIYILGLHLLPPDADESCVERWTARHGRTRVTTHLQVTACDRAARRETIRFRLSIQSGRRRWRVESDYRLRLYNAAQVRRLFSKVPQLQLLDVYDFWYDIARPLRLDDRISDSVFILRRRG